MATVHYRNAILLLEGSEIQTSLNELSITYAAEMLDETAFGDTTRIRKGGLFTASISGSGFAEFGADLIEELLFGNLGSDGITVSLFPNGITEGGTTTGMGYAMRGVLAELSLGETVGNLLAMTFNVEGRGIEA